MVQTATNPKTGQKVQLGDDGQWHAIAAAPGAPVAAPTRKLSAQDQKVLDTENAGAGAAWEARNMLNEAKPAAQRLQGGPYRGMFLDAAIPEAGGGILDKIGATLIGGPAKLLGALSDQDVQDYQTLRRTAALATRQSVTGEKGTQTEGDAARAMLSTVNPGNANNDEVVASAAAKAARQIGRAQFYTKWANTYGLNGVNQGGQSVEDAFQSTLKPAGHAAPSGVTITKVK